jgi:hypothetical protein
MNKNVLTSGLACAALAVGSGLIGTATTSTEPVFTKLWTHGHDTAGQVSEIPAFDSKTNTLWVAGVVGVDVLDAATGDLVQHIDVRSHGAVNSVAVFNGLAALAVEAKSFNAVTCATCDRRDLGKVLFYDTRTREPADGVSEVPVGSLPDMLTFTHDGSKLLVANEATPNAVADTNYSAPDPSGSVSIIDMETRTVLATAGFGGVPIFGDNVRTSTGMDFEPEYIAVTKDGTKAYVTLQEANAVGVLDLGINAFTRILGLGAKNFNLPGNEFDPNNNGTIAFVNATAKGLYMPDGVDTYKWKGSTFMVLANEGDFREDNADRTTASTLGFPSPSVLAPLRIVRPPDSSQGNVFAAGARSFSIRDADGEIVYDSGSLLDRAAAMLGIYDDGRSRDKGVEPEGVTLLQAQGRVYAFVGLERTLKAAVAVFDVTSPYDVRFLDMIVTDGDLSPEGLAAYHYRGNFYLAIANEVAAPGQATSHTTVYRIDLERTTEE